MTFTTFFQKLGAKLRESNRQSSTRSSTRRHSHIEQTGLSAVPHRSTYLSKLETGGAETPPIKSEKLDAYLSSLSHRPIGSQGRRLRGLHAGSTDERLLGLIEQATGQSVYQLNSPRKNWAWRPLSKPQKRSWPWLHNDAPLRRGNLGACTVRRFWIAAGGWCGASHRRAPFASGRGRQLQHRYRRRAIRGREQPLQRRHLRDVVDRDVQAVGMADQIILMVLLGRIERRAARRRVWRSAWRRRATRPVARCRPARHASVRGWGLPESSERYWLPESGPW